MKLRNAFCLSAVMLTQCIVLPIAGTIEVTTGFWDINDTEGIIFGCNLDVEDCYLKAGEPIAVVEAAVAQERKCTACGMVDIDAWPID